MQALAPNDLHSHLVACLLCREIEYVPRSSILSVQNSPCQTASCKYGPGANLKTSNELVMVTLLCSRKKTLQTTYICTFGFGDPGHGGVSTSDMVAIVQHHLALAAVDLAWINLSLNVLFGQYEVILQFTPTTHLLAEYTRGSMVGG